MARRSRIILLALGVLMIGAGFLAAQSLPGNHPPLKKKVMVDSDSLVITTKLGYQAALVEEGISDPVGIGVSTRGDSVYFTDYSDYVMRDRTHTIKTLWTPGYELQPCRLRGALYVGDGEGRIYRIDDDGQVTLKGHDKYGDYVTALDVDIATGTVYFITQFDDGLWNGLYKLPPNTDEAILMDAWPDAPSWGIAVKGNYLYITDYYYDSVWRCPKKGGSWQEVLSDLDGPTDLGFDKLGNMFVLEWDGGSVARAKPGSTKIVRIAEGFSAPFYMQFDASNTLYLTDYGAGEIWKLIK